MARYQSNKDISVQPFNTGGELVGQAVEQAGEAMRQTGQKRLNEMAVKRGQQQSAEYEFQRDEQGNTQAPALSNENAVIGRVANMAFNEEIKQRYITSVDADTIVTINDLVGRHPTDVQAFNASEAAAKKGVLKGVDPMLRGAVSDAWDRRAAQGRIEVAEGFIKSEQKKTVVVQEQNFNTFMGEVRKFYLNGEPQKAAEPYDKAKATLQSIAHLITPEQMQANLDLLDFTVYTSSAMPVIDALWEQDPSEAHAYVAQLERDTETPIPVDVHKKSIAFLQTALSRKKKQQTFQDAQDLDNAYDRLGSYVMSDAYELSNGEIPSNLILDVTSRIKDPSKRTKLFLELQDRDFKAHDRDWSWYQRGRTFNEHGIQDRSSEASRKLQMHQAKGALNVDMVKLLSDQMTQADNAHWMKIAKDIEKNDKLIAQEKGLLDFTYFIMANPNLLDSPSLLMQEGLRLGMKTDQISTEISKFNTMYDRSVLDFGGNPVFQDTLNQIKGWSDNYYFAGHTKKPTKVSPETMRINAEGRNAVTGHMIGRYQEYARQKKENPNTKEPVWQDELTAAMEYYHKVQEKDTWNTLQSTLQKEAQKATETIKRQTMQKDGMTIPTPQSLTPVNQTAPDTIEYSGAGYFGNLKNSQGKLIPSVQSITYNDENNNPVSLPALVPTLPDELIVKIVNGGADLTTEEQALIYEEALDYAKERISEGLDVWPTQEEQKQITLERVGWTEETYQTYLQQAKAVYPDATEAEMLDAIMQDYFHKKQQEWIQ